MTRAEYNSQMAYLKATEPTETIPASSERRAWEQALLQLVFGAHIEG